MKAKCPYGKEGGKLVELDKHDFVWLRCTLFEVEVVSLVILREKHVCAKFYGPFTWTFARKL